MESIKKGSKFSTYVSMKYIIKEEGCIQIISYQEECVAKHSWLLIKWSEVLIMKAPHIFIMLYSVYISGYKSKRGIYWDTFTSVLREETWLFSRMVVKNWFLSVKMSHMHTYAHILLCTNVCTHMQHTPLHTFTHRYTVYTHHQVFRLRAILPGWAMLYCQAWQIGVKWIWDSTTTFSCV